MLLVKCPNCGKNQKCQPKGPILTNKSKRCVYCGKTFKIHANIEQSRIVARV